MGVALIGEAAFPTCFITLGPALSSPRPLFVFTTTTPPTATMVLISSKTFIQAHAVLLVVVAGYLIKSPELITDSDVVFMMGEALQIVQLPSGLIRIY